MLKTAIRKRVFQLRHSYVTKILLVMKLTILLLTVGFLNVSAKGVSQNVSFTGERVPLKSVLNSVEKQTDYAFVYTRAVLENSKPVTITAHNVPLEKFLGELFKSQPLAFELKGKNILIFYKPMVETLIIPEPEIVYSPMRGRVVDEEGNALPGATVTVRNTKNVSVTDGSGMFNLDVKAGDVLVITHVGYQSQEIRVTPSQISSGYISITLSKVLSQLDEVQIIAYGTTTRRLSTSNISTVKGEDLAKSPVFNPLQALQGRVPGITIQSSSGLPGAYINVRIQGQNSLNRGNNPLYIVDGIPYPSNNLRNENGGLYDPSGESKSGTDNYDEWTQPGSPLNYINMNEIESIEILKDADATAIYGSRGANGVILITTKKGKAGPLRFDLDLKQGIGVISKRIKMLNTQEYLEMRREAYRNDGLPVPDKNTTPDNSNADLTMWDENKYTDWQKELLCNPAKYTNLHASATGGTENANYLAGLTYRRQTTVFPGDFTNHGAGANVNMNFSSTNKKIRGGISLQYFYDNSNNPGDDLTRVVSLAPNAPDLRNPDGSINWAPLPDGNSSFYNPLRYLEHRTRVNATNLISNANLDFEIIPGLFLKSTFAYNFMQSDGLATRPMTYEAPESRPYASRTTSKIDANLRTWQIEPQLTYTKNIGNGKLNLLLGTTFSQTYQYSQQAVGFGGSNDLLLKDIGAHPNRIFQPTETSKYKYNAGFARINYIWGDKYIVNLNGRRDGSSRFGSANALHSFGSVAGAWIFSNENFIKSGIPFLSYGKIHGSYGTIGNDNIGNYKHLSLYGSFGNGVDIPYQGTIALAPDGLPNPHLQWEEIRKLSIGLDLGFFKDRLLINAIWYRNRSSNQLTNYTLPQTTGFWGIDRNFPAKIQNTGWEFTVKSINFDGKNFKWSTDANLTIQRNKLLEFPGIESTSYFYSLVVGKPLNITRYYHYLGVSPETGLYLFEDEYGKPTSTPSDAARKVYRSAFPIFTAGMINTFTYKSFQLDFVLQIVKQYGMNLEHGNLPGNSKSNQPHWILDRWQKPGDNAAVQKLSVSYSGETGTAYGSYGNSDAGYGDASYVRMTNMTVGWFFPESIIKNIHLKSAKVFAQGQNLFTITPYKGFDPEQRTGLGWSTMLPAIRMITFGLQVSF